MCFHSFHQTTNIPAELEAIINESLRGFFTNSFFHIYIDGEFNPNISEVRDKKDKGTALHEYTHYIQNIGTLWGLYESIYHYEVLIEFKNAIINSTNINRPFKVPLSEALLKKKRIIHHGNGTTDYLNWIIDDKMPLTYEIIKVKINDKDRFQVNVSFTLEDGSNHTIQLGAHIIKESMAALYQSLLDPDTTHYDIPYNLVQKLTSVYFPNTAKDIKKLICACHASLFSMNPGLSLIEIIKGLEEKPNMSGFDFFNEYAHKRYVSTDKDEIILMTEFFNDMVDRFKYLLKSNLLSPLDYIDAALDRVKLSNSFYPFLSILYERDIFNEKDFSELIQYYGIPYIQTSNFGYHFPQGLSEEGQNGSSDVLELIAQEALFFNFVNPNKISVCPLYYMCQNSKYEKEECFDKPWEGQECSYSIVSSPLKLHTKNIV